MTADRDSLGVIGKRYIRALPPNPSTMDIRDWVEREFLGAHDVVVSRMARDWVQIDVRGLDGRAMDAVGEALKAATGLTVSVRERNDA